MKRYTIALFVLLFFLCNLNAQENSKVTSENQLTGKLKIGLFYSLDQNLSDKNQLFTRFESYAADYNRANYGLGLEIEYTVNAKFSFLSGLTYANRDFTGTYNCYVCDFIGVIEPEFIKQRFLEIPISVRYNFLLEKVLLFSEMGVVNQLVVENQLNENNYSASIKLAVGVGYRFNNGFSLEFSPSYQKSILKLYENSNFKQQILGFKVGVKKAL